MKKILCSLIFISSTLTCNAQDLSGWIKDINTGCQAFTTNKVNKTMTWDGDCVSGYASGLGTLQTFVNGKPEQVFKVTMVKGKSEGMGQFANVKNDSFVGEYLDGRVKAGVYTWSNGNRFEGEFKDGSLHKGIYYFLADGKNKGDVYSGDFVKWKFNGHGSYKEREGGLYVGDWVDGKRTGQGSYTWNDGVNYTGGWLNDKMHGAGVYTLVNGTKVESVWVNGVTDKKNFEIRDFVLF